VSRPVFAKLLEPSVSHAPSLRRVVRGHPAQVRREHPPVRVVTAPAVARPRARPELRRRGLVPPHRVRYPLSLVASTALVREVEL